MAAFKINHRKILRVFIITLIVISSLALILMPIAANFLTGSSLFS